MNSQDFNDKFKEKLNVLFENAAAKADRTSDLYWSGQMDGIDSVENLFDGLWREFEKENELIDDNEKNK